MTKAGVIGVMLHPGLCVCLHECTHAHKHEGKHQVEASSAEGSKEIV